MRWKAKITVPADIRFLGIVASFVSQMAKLAGMVQEEIFQVELAVDEACTNVIVHGYEEDGLRATRPTVNSSQAAAVDAALQAWFHEEDAPLGRKRREAGA